MEIARHRAAIFRTELSRPFRTALGDDLLAPAGAILDYGCGHGGDARQLRQRGFDCTGWDPVLAPDGTPREADLVNLGYVVNVIERPAERAQVLKEAWRLTRSLLVVSARLVNEISRLGQARPFGDGYVTKLGTFQKLYEQQELRTWIDQTLCAASVAAAPGIFYVFRSDEARATFVASRYRRRTQVPTANRTERLYEAHREPLQGLADFLARRGRLPTVEEWPGASELVAKLGTLKGAFRVLRSVSGDAAWADVREARAEDLLIYLALARFDRRPKLSDLPPAIQLDVKAFFASYQAACAQADELLYGLGDMTRIADAVGQARFGKRLPRAFYVHATAVDQLPLSLRLYEGCARSYAGTIDGANIIKFALDEPKISYLVYPTFETDPHPSLVSSTSVRLQTFKIRERRYDDSDNPPILHRKEAFVPASYPHFGMFERLTRQEERAGLYCDTAVIGTRWGWKRVLAEKGLRHRGHRLISQE